MKSTIGRNISWLVFTNDRSSSMYNKSFPHIHDELKQFLLLLTNCMQNHAKTTWESVKATFKKLCIYETNLGENGKPNVNYYKYYGNNMTKSCVFIIVVTNHIEAGHVGFIYV